ncbi:MAG: FkbM family methyltransferase [Akkermansiaceae bacterium]|nr:FkbM family methyltransferase [Akkermansiaceae bacterium]MCF7730768.1 FkbM family methyltransferase [Akkermansiaceae bacterium]
MSPIKEPPPKPPFPQKVAVIRQQLKNFERALRFYWKSLKPAPVTPHGFKLYGSRAMQDGRFEPLETRLIKQVLPHCDAFINVGANVGYYCCLAIQQGVPAFAFEPIDLNVRYLLANIRTNDWAGKIEIYPVALGAETGILEIFGAGTGASLIKGWANTPEYDVTLAPVLTLDQVLANRLVGQRCLIMVDIEGAEQFMLAGASRFLAADPKPVWMIEICVDQHQPDGTTINPHLVRTFEYFWSNGYHAWTAGDQPRRVEAAEVEAIARTGENTFESHNFLFADPHAAVVASILK